MSQERLVGFPNVVILANSTMMGGMEAHVEALGRGLVQRGVRVTAILPAREQIHLLKEQLLADGAEVVDLSADQRGPLGLMRRFLRIAGLVRRSRPCVFNLHCIATGGGALPTIAARLGGAKAVVRTEHDPPDFPRQPLKRAAIVLRDLLVEGFVCVAKASYAGHSRALGRKRKDVRVIYNGVDLAAFDPATADRTKVRKLAGAADETIVVGTVGRIERLRKGGEFFVEMAKQLADQRPDLRFVMVGEGPFRDELEERAAGSIAFLGRYPCVADCYAAMDVFVMPSVREGGPITVLEAMAMRRPVVATRVGMVPEVIEDGVNGFIVPPGDPSALAKAVLKLIENPAAAREVGECGRALIEERFSTDALVDAYVSFFADVSS